jgi:hypothetical protein
VGHLANFNAKKPRNFLPPYRRNKSSGLYDKFHYTAAACQIIRLPLVRLYGCRLPDYTAAACQTEYKSTQNVCDFKTEYGRALI